MVGWRGGRTERNRAVRPEPARDRGRRGCRRSPRRRWLTHARILAVFEPAGGLEHATRGLLVRRWNRAVPRAVQEQETGGGVETGEVRRLLALERRAHQDRRVEHVRMLEHHAIRHIAALGEPDEDLAAACEHGGVEQGDDGVAHVRALAAALLHAAPVRIPVRATHVVAVVRAVEGEIGGEGRGVGGAGSDVRGRGV